MGMVLEGKSLQVVTGTGLKIPISLTFVFLVAVCEFKFLDFCGYIPELQENEV